MVIGEVYEQEFYDFSYGFRPGRSAHQAVEAVQNMAWRRSGGWLVEVDSKKFFDTVAHVHLQEILGQRIGDGVLLRLIGKWLNAGVVEGPALSYPDEGTPQGGVISPLLANIYLHTVLDEWFVRDIQPALARKAAMVRYADDFVVLFERKREAERFLRVLPKRFGKYGLTLHPDKTRMISFRRPDHVDVDEDRPGTFDFLGFTHHWAVSRKGNWIVKQRTAKDRFRRALRRLRTWCRWTRHDSVEEQHRTLTKKLNGHYAYDGITSNFDQISNFCYRVHLAWHAALARRSQRGMSWRTMEKLLERYPLPAPRIVHRYGT
jgi:group II intron reverse transcriptase/maturase